jgi:hypothetical protein
MIARSSKFSRCRYITLSFTIFLNLFRFFKPTQMEHRLSATHSSIHSKLGTSAFGQNLGSISLHWELSIMVVATRPEKTSKSFLSVTVQWDVYHFRYFVMFCSNNIHFNVLAINVRRIQFWQISNKTRWKYFLPTVHYLCSAHVMPCDKYGICIAWISRDENNKNSTE